MAAIATLFIGIDVSKDHLVVAFKNNDQKWIIQKYKNNEQGIAQFIAALADPHNTFVILEATGTYSMKAVFALCQNNIKTAVLNPKQSKGFIQGVLLSTTKTDDKDACALALYGEVNKPKPFVVPSDKILQVKQLQNLVQQLKKQKRSLGNQLHALSFHPFPNEYVVKLTTENLERCEQQISQTQQLICQVSEETFKRAYELAISVIGIGPSIAQAILMATNALHDFDNSKQLAKFIGVCPTQFESGTSIKGRGSIAKTGDPYIRAMLYMGARSAKRFNPTCKLLYERLRSKGKGHKVAMVAVCNKLVRQLFAIVKNEIVFDKEFHLKTTQK